MLNRVNENNEQSFKERLESVNKGFLAAKDSLNSILSKRELLKKVMVLSNHINDGINKYVGDNRVKSSGVASELTLNGVDLDDEKINFLRDFSDESLTSLDALYFHLKDKSDLNLWQEALKHKGIADHFYNNLDKSNFSVYENYKIDLDIDFNVVDKASIRVPMLLGKESLNSLFKSEDGSLDIEAVRGVVRNAYKFNISDKEMYGFVVKYITSEKVPGLGELFSQRVLPVSKIDKKYVANWDYFLEEISNAMSKSDILNKSFQYYFNLSNIQKRSYLGDSPHMEQRKRLLLEKLRPNLGGFGDEFKAFEAKAQDKSLAVELELMKSKIDSIGKSSGERKTRVKRGL